jgi:hypothetical protein
MRTVRFIGLLAAVAIASAGCLPPTGHDAGSRGPEPATGAPPSPTAAAATSAVTGSPSFVPPTPTPAPTFFVVVVKRGDSLNTIAHTYGTSARSLAFWNRATYPSLDPESPDYRPGTIQPGWTLVLIPNLVYDEDSGEAVDPSGALPEP